EAGHRDGSSPIVQPERDAEEAARVEPDDAAPTAATPGGDHAEAHAPHGGVADVVDGAVTDTDGGPPRDEPPWARWLGDRRGWTDGMGARTTASEPFAPRLPAAPRDAAPQVAEPERPEATRGLPVTPASSPCAAAPASPASEGAADGNDPGCIDP